MKPDIFRAVGVRTDGERDIQGKATSDKGFRWVRLSGRVAPSGRVEFKGQPFFGNSVEELVHQRVKVIRNP